MTVKSMTGYGKGVYESDTLKLVVELKSVNHRFLDLSIKIPKQLNFAEDGIRRMLKEGIGRGHVEVYVNVEDKRAEKGVLAVDLDLARQYVEAARRLREELGAEGELCVADLIKTNNIVSFTPAEADEDELSAAAEAALADAIAALDRMRVTEGENLAKEMQVVVDRVAELAPDTLKQHADKVRERVAEYLKDVSIDEGKFLNEMAFYADKVAVDEELTRLNSHIPHFRAILTKGGAVGKQLDFVVQEMNRESNTIGSKCNDIRVAECVVSLKCTIEKLREQIQNLE